jgi:hypothetical protein
MHGPDLLYSRDPWSGVSAIKPREFITLVGGAAAGAGGPVLHERNAGRIGKLSYFISHRRKP